MKNLVKNLFFFVLLGLPSSFALAGGTVGNGGDVVNCVPQPGSPFTTTTLFEMFDIYEARVLRGWKPNLGNSSLTTKEKVELAISRFNRSDLYAPGMYSWLKENADNFWSDSVFVPNSELTDISDTFAITLPINCSLKQIAIQLRNPSLFEKRYVINLDFWNLLDSDNQAALVLHEIIYRIAIESGASDSVGTRLINSILFSDKISSLDWKEMMSAWQNAGFDFYSLGSSSIRFQFYDLFSSHGFLYDATGNVQAPLVKSNVCYPKSLSRSSVCIRIGSDELYTRAFDPRTDWPPYGWFTPSLYLKLSIYDTALIWSNDFIVSNSPGGCYSGAVWCIDPKVISLYEAYLGTPNSKFRLTVDKHNPAPGHKTLLLTDKLEIKSDSYCLHAKSSTDLLPDINVQKDNGSTYAIRNQKGSVCLSLAGDIIN